jgi:hypothetical protein
MSNGRLVSVVVLALGVAACGGGGCGPDLGSGLAEAFSEDTCTPVHGVCYAFGCSDDRHESTDKVCPGIIGVCCLPGAPPQPPPPAATDTVPSPPATSSPLCNGLACPPGCACRPKGYDAFGQCKAACACGPPADAGAADASDDAAGDADTGGAAADAGDDADAAPDASPPAVDRPCGSITCSSRCECDSVSLSVCRCFAEACMR